MISAATPGNSPAQTRRNKEVFFMKGYVTASGYMGYVENEYILFASEDDYFEYVDSLNF